MAAYYAVITLGASPINILDSTNGVTSWPSGAQARRLHMEPIRANTHAVYVGINNSVSSTDHIKEIAVPPAGSSPLDNYLDTAGGSDHNIAPDQYWVSGTSGEKLSVTIWSI